VRPTTSLLIPTTESRTRNPAAEPATTRQSPSGRFGSSAAQVAVTSRLPRRVPVCGTDRRHFNESRLTQKHPFALR
jgi:hypothetical protein